MPLNNSRLPYLELIGQGECKACWYGSVAHPGGIRCEHYDYVPCRLPQWRVSWEEPKDLKAPPEIPEGAEWKHWPVD